jgi:uncharacterized protein YkwD
MKIQSGLVCGLVAMASLLGASRPARAVGEAVGGFPNWEERVIHEWMNRARCDPQVEMTQCMTQYGAGRCGEAACFMPMAPLVYSQNLGHASRFHSDEMRLQSYFAHDSNCAVPSNINTLYPTSCQGAASCACTSGSPTAWNARVALFGTSPSGEIIASGTDPNSAFYQWLFEPSSATACAYSTSNGHRWNILESTGSVGTGVSDPSVGDFAGGNVTIAKLASGSHYPRQAAQVAVWANWYDSAGPMSSKVNVDGTCQALTRQRGSDKNGAYSAMVSGVGSGCHRYYFLFQDKDGQTVTYPTTGSLAIGPTTGCPDYDTSRPSSGAGCDVTIVEDGGVSGGDDGGTANNGGDDSGTANNGGGGAADSGCGCRVGGSAGQSGAAGPLGLAMMLSLMGFLTLRRRGSRY